MGMSTLPPSHLMHKAHKQDLLANPISFSWLVLMEWRLFRSECMFSWANAYRVPCATWGLRKPMPGALCNKVVSMRTFANSWKVPYDEVLSFFVDNPEQLYVVLGVAFSSSISFWFSFPSLNLGLPFSFGLSLSLYRPFSGLYYFRCQKGPCINTLNYYFFIKATLSSNCLCGSKVWELYILYKIINEAKPNLKEKFTSDWHRYRVLETIVV